MILSVSRRTDIPAFYSDWFFNRVKEGYLLVRNPMNYNQIGEINISPDIVDCIVFWTKDPLNMMYRLNEIDRYKYYFQFTLTPYDRSIETNMRGKKELLKTFINLSKTIGKEKVIWRYDPIILTEKYSIDYHIRAFKRMCELLSGYTEKCIISFLDLYKKTEKNMENIGLKSIDEEKMFILGKAFADISKEYGIVLESCAEKIDLKQFGIKHGSCIDKYLIEKIIGCNLEKLKKDNSREDCGCYECIDIGQYDTCVHNCLYCYANRNHKLAVKNYNQHNSDSPILLGKWENYNISERKVRSFKVKNVQLKFDI